MALPLNALLSTARVLGAASLVLCHSVQRAMQAGLVALRGRGPCRLQRRRGQFAAGLGLWEECGRETFPAATAASHPAGVPRG